MQNYLEVSHLRFEYHSGFSLHSQHFFLKKAEIVALIGPSGSGKTTFLRLIAGLIQPSSGQIILDQMTLFNKKVNIETNKRKIGLVFQDYALFPHLTVEKNVAFAFYAAKKKCNATDIQKQLEWVGLEKTRYQYPFELSGGQQQRVALIRALVPDPKLLLMDEPFVGLDMVLRKNIIAQTIKILRSSKKTVLIVTHNVQDVENFVDRIELWN